MNSGQGGDTRKVSKERKKKHRKKSKREKTKKVPLDEYLRNDESEQSPLLRDEKDVPTYATNSKKTSSDERYLVGHRGSKSCLRSPK